MVILEYSLLFILTLATYFGALWLFRKTRFPLLHPLITSAGLIILVLSIFNVTYETFRTATLPIDLLLGPTVVALGWALYKQIEHLKAHFASIITSVTVGAMISILSIMGIMRIFGSSSVEVSMLAKSVTTPIALKITEQLSGIPSITSFVVIITGILGGIIGPGLLEAFGVSDTIARGLAMGSAAHGVGTAKAMEMGAIEGAISGLAIGLMGLITALIIPLVKWFVY